MYENNYPNNYGTENKESTGSFSGNTYHYSQPIEPKAKKQSVGAGKKIMLGICCGLLFGIFAGLGFEAVITASDLIKGNNQIEATALPEKEEGRIGVNEAKTSGEALDTDDQIAATAAISEDKVVRTSVTDVTEVVKKVMPSVVSVNNRYTEITSFWGQQYSSEGNSTGSGIIVGQKDTELLLVTNYHVVEAAEELTVQFVDASQAQAQIKGVDADKDLAVIAVQLKDIEPATMNEIAIARLGNSNDLTVGEPVIAIGNALGYGQSVTTGVVSALNRAIAVDNAVPAGDTEVNTFIQTDAAINPGNSGGALLNIDGEVIGINSNKIGGSAVEGMGYAIPISDAQPIIENLMSKQTRLKVDEDKKGYLGITGIDVVSEYSQTYGVPKGVYVSSVSEGTGAAAAGLVKGDIITAVNGEEVSSMDDLKNELSYYTAGTAIELTIMQGSPTGYQSKTVEVTLGSINSAR